MPYTCIAFAIWRQTPNSEELTLIKIINYQVKDIKDQIISISIWIRRGRSLEVNVFSGESFILLG
jgi:hypothetical protein